MNTASKEVCFCYAHRIVGHHGKCGTLHGHNGRVAIRVESGSLDRLGMVVDFALIKEAVGGTAELWDHKCILDESDPLCDMLEAAGQRVVRVPFPPTAENFARRFFDAAKSRGLPVAEVVFWESDSCCASYKEDRR